MVSSELDFRTAKEEEERIVTITNLNIFDLQNGEVTADAFKSSWKTNKDATTCLVYGEASLLASGTEPNFGYAYRTAGCDQLDEKSVNHNQLVGGLKACTTYYYRAVAYNGIQRAISSEQSVRTACIGAVAGASSVISGGTIAPQISSNPSSTEITDENGEVKEAETSKAPGCGINGITDCVNECILWLLILIIVLLLLYIWKKREDEKRIKRQSGGLV